MLLALAMGTAANAGMAASAQEGAAPVPEASRYTFFVGFGPGGVPDLAARLIAEKIQARHQIPAVVVNKPGVGGMLAAQDVLDATPDGSTLLSVTPAHATAPAVYRNLRYDTLKDFAPVTLIGDGPAVVIVPAASTVVDMADLVRRAKAEPGRLTYSSAGVGGSTHFAAELLRQKAGIEVLHVPYKGVAQAMTEVVAGRVDFTVAPYVAAVKLVQAGKVRALAVAGKQHMPEMPDVPTVPESGVPGYEWSFWYGLLVSAKTPPEAVARLNREVVAILHEPDIQTRLGEMGVAIAASSPEAFQALLTEEVAKFKAIATAANIQPN
ncbi:tripartite tricarboxylate transporter substrate-binding protein [Denitromonas iodatirespirans]|uniref:Tripartite tricarboxylate transporter substrate binding protein n=1 Tax=Denitromonas iodatirespirans TaxID=2795389 RepID=A0A944H8R1_DENI1|nr:tripartite tricarboxylate transporter substrate-binding protein [Denitromonas iodatirespirans]MBT0961645.1 hypothetical protein [Denitromonas iodatirespirans]